MYIPPSFNIEEFDKLTAVMQQHSFATVITHAEGAPFASHLPLLFHPQRGPHGTLFGHLARANPQWRHFANGEAALAIFQGPHAYVSPSWYASEVAVPTWNYVTVHAYGRPRIIEDETELWALLQELIDFYEAGLPQPWRGDLPAAYKAQQMKAIVGFEMPLSRIEGKFKLGQNKSAADRQSLYQALRCSPAADDQKLADIMQSELGYD